VFRVQLAVASGAYSVASTSNCSIRDLVDRLSASNASDSLILEIEDSKLYISFSIGPLGFALLCHFVLSSRSRFGGASAALAWVRRSLGKHVTLSYLTLKKQLSYYLTKDLALTTELS
jgi:hypothetical protein